MAVLFPTPFGHTLNPARPAELLQGFQNIQNVENVKNGQLTQADLTDYGQKRFIAADPSSAVASYLTQNFSTIAKQDGNANSISVDDLVQIRSGLPTPPPVTNPPSGGGANGGSGNDSQALLQVLFQFIQQIFNALFQTNSAAGN